MGLVFVIDCINLIMTKKTIYVLFYALFSLQVYGQDTPVILRDSLIVRNPLSKTSNITGVYSVGYGNSNRHEFSVGAGVLFRKGNCGCIGCSWYGVDITPAYSIQFNEKGIFNVGEFSVSPQVFAIGFGIGSELSYLRDFTNKSDYFRPSIVLNLVYFEFSYSYVFNLNNNPDLGHRFGLKFKWHKYD